MRLCFKPGACSLSSRIVLTELGLPHEENVDAKLARRIGDVERSLADAPSFILGESFTLADTYLFVVLNWSNFVGVDLNRWPHVAAFMARMASRLVVRAAMLREGLIQEAVA